MRSLLWPAAMLALSGCSFDDGEGTQIGALKEGTVPLPPSDLTTLDVEGAVQEAFDIAGRATLGTAWAAHVSAMAQGTEACPNVWLGAPPENLVEIDGGNEDRGGLSWVDNCTTPLGTSYEGFSYWEWSSQQVDPTVENARAITMDGVVRAPTGELLLDFDGEAADQLGGDGSYASNMVARVLQGSLVGFGSGVRVELEAQRSGATLELAGTVHVNDGFGPPDTRDRENSPELTNITDWEAGAPRYTSVRYDLDFTGDCDLEPRGYVGVRGNEGFWFDVYFLPKYDPEEDAAQAASFPFESIDNVECDGIGTLFVRNLDLRAVEAENQGWSREVAIDFSGPTGIIASFPRPNEDGFLFTVQQLPDDEVAP